MKILLISPCHKNFGGWYRTYAIADALVKLGHMVGFAYSPKYYNSVWGKVFTGLKNCLYVKDYDLVYGFEVVHPETLLPLLYAKLMFRQTVVDVGDEWLDSPTYHNSGWGLRSVIRFLDLRLINLFRKITVTSEYLKKKYKRGLVLINGVNTNEFPVISKDLARKVLGYGEDDKVVLSFGNTYSDSRLKLLGETIKQLPGDIKVISGVYLNRRQLMFYSSACDLFLFPTDSSPAEKACFPIRIGTYLNAERVIATISNDTQFKKTLKKFDCMVTGKNPKDLADNIVKFFKNTRRRKELESNILKAKKELDWYKLIGRLNAFIV